MTAEYCILNPSGNITALVTSFTEEKIQPAVAGMIMKKEPSVEQVGFVDAENRVLRMAGGEFCGNASMCAAVMCVANSPEAGKKTELFLSVSGASGKVRVTAEKTDAGFMCAVSMPPARGVSEKEFRCGNESFILPVVEFDGISHIINEHSERKNLFYGEIKKWCADLGCGCLGIMNVDAEMRRITPLVYVPGSETLVWENSCASGTAAAGIYYAEKNGGRFDCVFSEPGGFLGVSAENGSVCIKGNVSVTECGKTIEI